MELHLRATGCHSAMGSHSVSCHPTHNPPCAKCTYFTYFFSYRKQQ